MDHLTVDPATADVTAGTSQDDTAEGFDRFDNALRAETGSATFSLTGGSCAGNTCIAGQVGAQTVTATVGTVSATAKLTVAPGRRDHPGGVFRSK